MNENPYSGNMFLFCDNRARIEHLSEQLRLIAYKTYVKKGEKVNPNQPTLFDFDEAEQIAKPEKKEILIKAHKRTVKKKEINYDNLPTVQIIHDIPQEIKEQYGDLLVKIGTVVNKKLVVIPATYTIEEHIYIKYAVREDVKNGIESKIIVAKAPNPLISGSVVSPSLLAHIVSRKYNEALPLYRQEQIFKGQGVNIPRQNMANWIINTGEAYLSMIYDRLKYFLLMKSALHIDETVLQVLDNKRNNSNSKAYMWLYRTLVKEKQSIVLYEYQDTRAGIHPQNFLKGFKGYIHTDCYAGYNKIPDTTIVGCFAHARRRFYDAMKSVENKPESNYYKLAVAGLEFILRLFKVERECKEKNLTYEERYNKRLEVAKPILEEFKNWLVQSKDLVPPKLKLGDAISYTLNNWIKLSNYLLNGQLEIENNLAERAIKPFVIGRKNWLFSASTKGARVSATTYSIIQTAINNDLIPYEYLKYLYENLPNVRVDDYETLDKLLPWSEDIPDYIKVPKIN